ncbi:MAG TPA: hypothetical protein VGS41_03085, partial [Chthonomonadales bacterium]|nr:hypothetical protein [Chthonomonadales bacterium]
MRAYLGSLSAKIITVPIVVFLIGLLAPGWLGYNLLCQSAHRETREKALMLARLAAQEKSSQAANADSISGAPGAPFEVRKLPVSIGHAPARTDDLDARIVDTFVQNPALPEVEQEVDRPEGRCLAVGMPVPGPPRAHSRDAARQIAAVVIAYVPLASPMAQAASIAKAVVEMVAVLAILCLILLAYRAQSLVAIPCNKLLKTSQAIRSGDWTA